MCTNFLQCSGAENYFFGAILDIFALYLVQIYHYIHKKYAENAPSKDAIWDEFGEQDDQQNIKKRTIFNA